MPSSVLVPIVLPVAALRRSTPCAPLGIAEPPAASVPIRARETVLLLAPVMAMPWAVLPEITFREPGGPPIVFRLADVLISMPRRLGMAAVPAAFVPMKLPCTWVPVVAAPEIRIPSLPFPEITLRASVTSPPITLFVLADAPNTPTPWPPLPRSRVPLTSRPM